MRPASSLMTGRSDPSRCAGWQWPGSDRTCLARRPLNGGAPVTRLLASDETHVPAVAGDLAERRGAVGVAALATSTRRVTGANGFVKSTQ